ncbi:uncharacterized protein METZ01_LOCUS271114, partial [marine metagenome]
RRFYLRWSPLRHDRRPIDRPRPNRGQAPGCKICRGNNVCRYWHGCGRPDRIATI